MAQRVKPEPVTSPRHSDRLVRLEYAATQVSSVRLAGNLLPMRPHFFWASAVVLAIFAGGARISLVAAEAATIPTLFVVGDSTAHNTGKAKNGQLLAGWGTPLADYFDASKVRMANVAHAGQSSRSYFKPFDASSVRSNS